MRSRRGHRLVEQRPSEPLGRAFTALWGASGASNLADGLLVGLLPLIAVASTSSPMGVAGVTVAATLAWPVFGLGGGLVVDRLNQRSLLAGVNLARAVVLAALAFACAAGGPHLWFLYAVALLLAVGETVGDTSLTSMVPRLVPPHRRGAANARIESTINLLNGLVGPPLAGVLFVLGATTASLAAGFLYAAAVVLLAAVPRAATVVPDRSYDRGEPLRSQLAAGARVLWADAVVRRLTVSTAMMNLTWGAWSAVFVIYLTSDAYVGLSSQGYGVVLAAMAVGGLAVAPVVDPLARRLGVERLLMLDLLGTVLLVAPAALGAGAWLVALGVAAAGAGSTVWRSVVATVRQNRVDHDVLGRVYAASRIISWGVLPLAALAAGVIGEVWGVRAALGAATVVAGAALVTFPAYLRTADLDAAYLGADADGPAAADPVSR